MRTAKRRVIVFLIVWFAMFVYLSFKIDKMATNEAILNASLLCTLSVAVMVNLAIAELKNKNNDQ